MMELCHLQKIKKKAVKKEEKIEEEGGERVGRGGRIRGVLENKALIKACDVVQIVRQCHTNVPF